MVSPQFAGSNLFRPHLSQLLLQHEGMKSLCVVVVLTSILSLGQRLALAQGEQSTGARKVIRQVIPQYPFMARQMSLSGTVRLEAVVRVDGEVKTILVEGGHPILVQSALSAAPRMEVAKERS